MAKKTAKQALDEVQALETIEDAEIQVLIAEASSIAEDAPIVDEITKPLKVGQRARQLILMNELSNAEILAILQKEYPTGRTSMACIAWYKSDVKKAKAKLPDPDQGYKDWLKLMDKDLRAEYEATLVKE